MIPVPERLCAAARIKAAEKAAEAARLRASEIAEIERAARGGPAPGDGYWERRHRTEREAEAYAALAAVLDDLIGEDAADRAGGRVPGGPVGRRLTCVTDVVSALGGRRAAQAFFGVSRARLGTWLSRERIPAEFADFTRAGLPGCEISGTVFAMVRAGCGAPRAWTGAASGAGREAAE